MVSPGVFDGVLLVASVWVDLATFAFLLVLGANLGSFLNVVAHRVPRGESVVFGGSRCPSCQTAIRPRDNIPVLGWVLLHGRCRDCLAPIAVRYPLVEAAAGVVVGGVAGVELLSGGGNLPAGAAAVGDLAGGVDNLLFRPHWELLGIIVWHMLLLVTLLAWTLLEQDRQAPPWRWAGVLLVFGLAATAIWPWLLPVPCLPMGMLSEVSAGGATSAWQPVRMTAAWGGLFGWAIGVVLFRLRLAGGGMPAGCALVGLTCGWQAAATTLGLLLLVAVARAALAGLLATGRAALGESDLGPSSPCAAGGKAEGFDGRAWPYPATADFFPGPGGIGSWGEVPAGPDREPRWGREGPSRPRLRLSDLVMATVLQLLFWRLLDGSWSGWLAMLPA